METHPWIQKAISHPGALREKLHVKEGDKIPAAELKSAAKGNDLEAKQARLAITLGKLRAKRKARAS